MKIDNDSLAQLNSIQELKNAQRQVNRGILRLERKWNRKYRDAKAQFSIKSALMYGMEAVDTIQSIVRYARQGYSAMMGGKRKHGCRD